jgi:hypothetical protein
MTGVLLLLASLLGSLWISYEVQKYDLLLGYAIGVALMFLSVLFSTDFMARRFK